MQIVTAIRTGACEGVCSSGVSPLGFRSWSTIYLDWVYSLVRIPVPFIKLVYRYALFKAKFLNGEVVRQTLTLV